MSTLIYFRNKWSLPFIFSLFPFLSIGQNANYFIPPQDTILSQVDSLQGVGDFTSATEVFSNYKKNRIDGADQKLKAFCFLKMAELYLLENEIEKAKKQIDKSQSIIELEQDVYLRSELTFLLGKFLNKTKDVEKAVIHLEKAIELKQKLNPCLQNDLGKCYQELVVIYKYKLYDIRQTEKYLLKTLDIIKQNSDYPVYPKAICYYNLSSHFRAKGEVLKALSYAKEEVLFAKRLGDNGKGLLSGGYGLLANAYLVLEEYDTSIDYYEKAFQITEKNARQLIYFRTNLGLVYLNKGEYEKALNSYQMALKSTSNQDVLGVATAYQKIGEVYLEMNVLDSAFIFLEQSLKLFQDELSNEKSQISSTYNLLGRSYAKANKDSIAFFCFHKSISSVDSFKLESQYSLPRVEEASLVNLIEKLLADKAHFLSGKNGRAASKKDLYAALDTYRLIDSIYIYNSGFLEIETALHDNGFIHEIYGDAIGLLYRLYAKEKVVVYLSESLKYMERVKSRILLNQLALYKNADHLEVPLELLVKEEKLKNELEEFLFDENIKRNEKNISNTKLLDMLDRREQLQNKIKSIAPKYYQSRYQKESDLGKLQNYLEKREKTFVQYFWTEEFIYGIFFNHGKFVFKRIENTNQFKAQLEIYQEILFNGKEENNAQLFAESASYLYQSLIKPFVQEELPRQLVIVPDGPLTLIPFDAFLNDYNEKDGDSYFNLPYLIRSSVCSYVFSSKSLVDEIEEDDSNTESNIAAFSFSDDKYERSENGLNLSELPGAIEELNRLQKIFKSDFSGYYGKDASKQNFFNQLEHASILHLALHAESDPSIRQNSRIYFRPTNDLDSSSYVCYAHELYNKKVNAKLAVLSACETGQGKYYRGEGVFSIARGFRYVGVPSVVMSLWKTSDQSGAQIFEHFYKEIKKGATIDASLQFAKIKYLENADERTAHPSNWAAFIGVGSQTAVVKTSKFNLLVLASLGVVLIFACVFYIKMKNH